MNIEARHPGAAGRTLGVAAVVADLVLALLLTAVLLAWTNVSLDAVPRPLALLALFATPGLIGAIGVRAQRRSLLLAAGFVLLPGSLLSFAGVTLVFAVPAVLFVAAAATMPRLTVPVGVEAIDLAACVELVFAAAVALFTLTANTCGTSDGMSECGSGVLTVEGVVVEVVLLAVAVAFAAWRAGLTRGFSRSLAS